jgi:molybdopterin-guanine dinucleotide biosynthesis protein B
VVPRAQPVWKLYTTGAAGGQGLVGQPMIHRLTMLPDVAVWPFDPTDARVVLAEVYPSLLARAVAADPAPIKDEAQVRLLSRALWRLSQTGRIAPLFATPGGAVTTEEGWILGAGHGPALEAALA